MSHIPFDYATLRVIWFVLLAVLLIGFAIMDGFDVGAGMLLPFVGKSDFERREILNAIGPVWEGNQVWFILGGGAIFAAWPLIYATAFSGFYLAMFLVLIGFILRPVSFKYRSKKPDPSWRRNWDMALSIASLLIALICGVAFGNVLQGVPFHFDDNLRVLYTGTLFGLLNPFALLCGLVSVCMLLTHGGLYIKIKTNIDTTRVVRLFAMLTIVLFAVAGIWVARLDGYQVSSIVDMSGPSNPLYKTILVEKGHWLMHYKMHQLTRLAPILGFAGSIMAIVFVSIHKDKLAFVSSATAIAGIMASVGVSMFPILLPSSSHPGSSLTVWDASSSHLTLFIMLVATIIFLPIILAYTAFIYRVMRGKVDEHVY